MEIRNVNSVNFEAMHVNTSKMSRKQRRLSNSLTRALDYTNEYQQASLNNIDVYLLPIKNAAKNSIKIRFIDINSDKFIKNSKREIVETKINEHENVYSKVDEIRQQLADILSGKYPLPKYSVAAIVNSKTDVAKMNPQRYKDMFEKSEEDEKRIGVEEARTLIKDIDNKFNKDSEF